MYMPMVIKQSNNGERAFDLPSALLEQRIIMVDSEVNEVLSGVVGHELLILDSQNSSDIYMYITSPGGSVHHGLKIADLMENSRSDVITISTGYTASMGCFLTVMGAPGKRFMTRRSYMMAHQVSAQNGGTIMDMEKSFEHSKGLNELLHKEMAERIGVTTKQLIKACERDYWMSAEEALNYGKFGFIDGIITGKRNEDKKLEILRRDNKIEYWG